MDFLLLPFLKKPALLVVMDFRSQQSLEDLGPVHLLNRALRRPTFDQLAKSLPLPVPRVEVEIHNYRARIESLSQIVNRLSLHGRHEWLLNIKIHFDLSVMCYVCTYLASKSTKYLHTYVKLHFAIFRK